jgi:hypothetical protein
MNPQCERVRIHDSQWRFIVQQSNFSRMSPPRVGASSRVGRNTRNNARVMQTGTEDMPTIMDVDEIHTPDYEPTYHAGGGRRKPITGGLGSLRRMRKGQNLMRLGEKGHNRKNMPWVQHNRA